MLAHPLDGRLLEQGIAGRLPMHRTPGCINWMVYTLFIRRAGNTVEPVVIDHWLNDGDVLPVAGGMQVIHTPGHSAGHISLLLKQEGLLIAGDICANFGSAALSTVYEDAQLGRKGIIKAAAFDFDTAVFGHGNALRGNAAAKLRKKFDPLPA